MAVLAEKEFKSSNGRIFTFRSMQANEGEIFNEFMQKIAHETQNTYQIPGVSFSIEERNTRFTKARENLTDLMIGVFLNEQLVGTLNFYVFMPQHPWAKHVGRFAMMLLKDVWGEGLAQELLRLAEVQAQSIGVTRIEAEVRAFNDRGVALYKNAGYKIEGTRKKAAFIDGKYNDEYFIAKILNEKFPKWTPPTLTTNRLTLRAITLDDAPSMFEYAKNPNMTKFVLWEPHQSLKDTANGIKNYFFQKYDNLEPEAFAITLKSDPSKIIGTVGTWFNSEKSQCMEMGYALSEEYWNQGILTEAANEVIRYCFEEYSNTIAPVNRIQAHCKLENAASARVMEKVGMQYEAVHRQRVFSKNRFWDMKVYAILKEDWLKSHPTPKPY